MASALGTTAVPLTSRKARPSRPLSSLQPERKLRLFSKNEFTLEMNRWPKMKGGTQFSRLRSFGWNFFENADQSWVSHYVNLFILGCIILSAIVMVVESIPGVHKKNTDVWEGLEAFFVVTFSLEFVVRILCCPAYGPFFKSGMNYVDFFSILPWYLNFFLGDSVNLSFLRILRLGRALRLVKLSRYSSGVRLITSALEQSVDALYLFLFILVILVIVCSSAVYYAERGTYDEATGLYMREDPFRGYLCCAGTTTAPCVSGTQSWAYPGSADFTCEYVKERSPYQSIPAAFWWCMVTLTTVGYGDDYPVTWLGQSFGTFTQLLGVVTLALPLSIIGSNFIDERSRMLEESQIEKLTENNTVPGTAYPLIFQEQRLDMILERMDLVETELQNLSQQCQVSVTGALKLKAQMDPRKEGGEKASVQISQRTLDTMNMLARHMQTTLTTMKPHLS